MPIRVAAATDVEIWAALRAALWPDGTPDQHRDEIAAMLAAMDDHFVAFVAITETGAISGFVEASLRRDYVNGCETSPVAFVEGIFVQAEHRGTDIGRALCAAVEAWARTKGCVELASDALVENSDSHAFHRAVGFEETERVVYFRKLL
jgi:aminoglycoside 6'-N-acetyltransferase I